ncbi:polysaccharide pyruvyl transferase family protein [Brachybacterium tyrofermentans]|uniref:polysaccharide pyruvyl transferase family protein n=1 Tax=Brachybacterium tyrofermentans TaxID=47848 RepID=UPI003FD5354B
MRPPIKIFWWRWQHPHRLNFGDEITAPLVERITGRRVSWAPPEDCELVGAGSVIHMILKRRGENNPQFWGSGFIEEPSSGEPLAIISASAVRGKKSLSRIENSSSQSVSLGDPGLLAPLLFDGQVTKRYALGVIPHYRDAKSDVVDRLTGLGVGVRVIDVSWTPEEVAREIASCDVVISSSLHGLIFSDALGVPNAHVRLGGRVKGGLYKFYDYYSAFPDGGRYREYVVPNGVPLTINSIVSAVVERYVEPTGLRGLQDGLIRALRDL